MGPEMCTQKLQSSYGQDVAHSWTGTIRSVVTLKRQGTVDFKHVVTILMWVTAYTYMYITLIEKTAWQTQNGGVSPMVTQHDSLVFPGSILHFLI